MKTLAIVLLCVSTVPSRTTPVLEERRTFYPGGKPFEVRHFFNGKEEGLQQAWTEDGQLYVNYEMRNGRRYGFVNARPCSPVKEGR